MGTISTRALIRSRETERELRVALRKVSAAATPEGLSRVEPGVRKEMGTRPNGSLVLPAEVRDLAARLGVSGDARLSAVQLSQHGTMRNQPAGREMRFRADQTIELRHPGFVWRASTGPFGFISVVDALKDGQARLDVRAFHRLRIGGATGGETMAKGEIMRYLAELAWAPDAILLNRSLLWSVIDDRTLRVSAGLGGRRGELELQLNGSGYIEAVMAQDRPRKEGSGFVERPWHGRFFDYRKHEQRWLPFGGEVGWLVKGEMFTAWRGELMSWRID